MFLPGWVHPTEESSGGPTDGPTPVSAVDKKALPPPPQSAQPLRIVHEDAVQEELNTQPCAIQGPSCPGYQQGGHQSDPFLPFFGLHCSCLCGWSCLNWPISRSAWSGWKSPHVPDNSSEGQNLGPKWLTNHFGDSFCEKPGGWSSAPPCPESILKKACLGYFHMSCSVESTLASHIYPGWVEAQPPHPPCKVHSREWVNIYVFMGKCLFGTLLCQNLCSDPWHQTSTKQKIGMVSSIPQYTIDYCTPSVLFS